MAGKIAYLTIDDGPSEKFSEKIDYLISKKIPAVWFCLGKNLKKKPDQVTEAIKQGFIIANHSYDHPRFSKISLKMATEQITKTDNLINNLYEQASIKRQAKYFRFPYGDKGWGVDVQRSCPKDRKQFAKSLQNYLQTMDYTQPNFKGVTYPWFKNTNLGQDIDAFWTYDCLEWSIIQKKPFMGVATIADVLERMDMNDPENFKGLNDPNSAEIILIHDHLLTSDIFFAIIEKLLEKKFEFKLPKI